MGDSINLLKIIFQSWRFQFKIIAHLAAVKAGVAVREYSRDFIERRHLLFTNFQIFFEIYEREQRSNVSKTPFSSNAELAHDSIRFLFFPIDVSFEWNNE